MNIVVLQVLMTKSGWQENCVGNSASVKEKYM